jgi:hypothetical protein
MIIDAPDERLIEARRELIVLAQYINGVNTQPWWRDLQVGCPVCHAWVWETNQYDPYLDIKHVDTCVESEALEIVAALMTIAKEVNPL